MLCTATCFLTDNIYDYYNVSQGKITIPGMDDGEEFRLTDVRLDKHVSNRTLSIGWILWKRPLVCYRIVHRRKLSFSCFKPFPIHWMDLVETYLSQPSYCTTQKVVFLICKTVHYPLDGCCGNVLQYILVCFNVESVVFFIFQTVHYPLNGSCGNFPQYVPSQKFVFLIFQILCSVFPIIYQIYLFTEAFSSTTSKCHLLVLT